MKGISPNYFSVDQTNQALSKDRETDYDLANTSTVKVNWEGRRKCKLEM